MRKIHQTEEDEWSRSRARAPPRAPIALDKYKDPTAPLPSHLRGCLGGMRVTQAPYPNSICCELGWPLAVPYGFQSA
eukprot:1129964-Pyramimonas_sp.AAC.1